MNLPAGTVTWVLRAWDACGQEEGRGAIRYTDKVFDLDIDEA